MFTLALCIPDWYNEAVSQPATCQFIQAFKFACLNTRWQEGTQEIMCFNFRAVAESGFLALGDGWTKTAIAQRFELCPYSLRTKHGNLICFGKCSLEQHLQIGLFNSTFFLFPPSLSQPHSEEKDSEEEWGEGDALPAEGRGRRAGARWAGLQQEGMSQQCLQPFLPVFLVEKFTLVICFMARSSPGTRLLPWYLTPCQYMYPLKPSLTVCVYVHVSVGFVIKILTVAKI